MASIFGEIQIHKVTGGIVNFGNTMSISPKSAVKDPSGGGSKNVGGWVMTSTGISCTNYIDPDVSDQKLDEGLEEESLFP
ncbi:spore germination protein [Bacillus sp. DTU_2020_1000418_1_SI_GHA_SEK_038]|uniref:spore germination protein n=1 Tax=Bacillus sp. DTU_2020_1000418_1_SI_GHA_SEK_038 TaxID=3077585 RepID=UPI0028F00D2C|nr:spore germination protein [Bacillus sp. DTU_2020_1000418_1_SI_GHA_SEK_038]WNS76076.1 spore germination protein [Bacillus sp. DTU_2020_1000418_1_SI_GHA_SEK_038]